MGTIHVDTLLGRKDESRTIMDKLLAISKVIAEDASLAGRMNQAVAKNPGSFCAVDVPATDWIDKAVVRLRDYIDVIDGQISTVEVEWPPRGKKA